MMTYEEFKQTVVSTVKERLQESYGDFEVKIVPMLKVNQRLECIQLLPPPEMVKDLWAMPNVYLDELYEQYEKTEDMNGVMYKIASGFCAAFLISGKENELLDPKLWIDRVVINLVNTQDNKELLENMPHREFLDLSVIYRFIKDRNKSGLTTVRIDDHLLQKMELTEEELYQRALKNTKRMFPIKQETPEVIEIHSLKSFNLLHMLTNEAHIQGAACLLFEEELYKLSQKIDDNFYVLPSSVHEVIAVPEKGSNPESLKETICFVNKQECVGVDKLSDTLYFYDRDKRALGISR